MARVYSAQLAVGTVDAEAVTIYTVPANQKAVVLDVVLLNVGSSDAELLMGITPAGGGTLPIWHLFSASPMSGGSFDGRIVLNAGDSLVLGTEGLFSYVVSGYLFLV